MTEPGVIPRWIRSEVPTQDPEAVAEPTVDAEALRAQVEAEARAEGYRAGQRAAAEEARGLLESLRRAVDEAGEASRAVHDHLASLADPVWRAGAAAVAEEALTALFQQHPDRWAAYVDAALAECPPGPVTVRLAPEALTVLLAADNALRDLREAVTWVADPALTWSDIEVRWAQGGWWAGLRARLWALVDPGAPPPV